METFQKIDLRRARSFGEILNATFAFIHQNFKKLGKTILFIVGPFILLSAVFSGWYNAGAFNVQSASAFSNVIPFLFLLFFSSLGTVVLVTVVCEYVVVYMNKTNNEFEMDDVWRAVRQDFWMLLGTCLGVAIAGGLALFLSIIPGAFFASLFGPVLAVPLVIVVLLLPAVYLVAPMSIAPMMRVSERLGFFAALLRCFKLVANSQWRVFGLLLVTFLIYFALAFIFYLPQYVLSFWLGLHAAQQNAVSDFRFLFIATSTIAIVAGYFFYVIPTLAVAFQYFSLVERKEAPGLMEKIEQIGASSNAENAGIQLG
jgi:hypothetical protein